MAHCVGEVHAMLRSFYLLWGKLVARFWLWHLVAPVLAAVALGSGVVYIPDMRVNDLIAMYAPKSAACFAERAVIGEHWPLDADEFAVGRSYDFDRYLFVIATSRRECDDGGGGRKCDLMATDGGALLARIEELEDYLANNISVALTDGRQWHYEGGPSAGGNSSRRLCLGFWGQCTRVAQRNGFLNMLRNKERFGRNGFHVRYPQSDVDLGTPIYMAFYVGGVTLNETSREILEARAVRLVFFLRGDTEQYSRLSSAWEDEAERYLSRLPAHFADELDVAYMHSRTFDRAGQANAASLEPLFAVSFGLLMFFSALNMTQWRRAGGGAKCIRLDAVRTRPLLATAGLLTAVFAFASGIGCLMWLSFDYMDNVAVVPFLIMSIGVDDMFIIVAAWEATDAADPPHMRLSQCAGDAAVAVTITSLTSALSFAVGSISDIAAVRAFCTFAAVSIAFNYLYQVTFFLAAVYVHGRWQAGGRLGLAPCIRARTRMAADAGGSKTTDADCDRQIKRAGGVYVANGDLNSSAAASEQSASGSSLIHKYYGPLLSSYSFRATTLAVYLLYLAVSLYGCSVMRQGLEFEQLVMETSDAFRFTSLEAQYLDAGIQVEVIVNNPPSLVQAENRRLIERVVGEFESSPFTFGREGTQFWLRAYIEVMNKTGSYLIDGDEESWLYGVARWSTGFAFFPVWGGDIKWTTDRNKCQLDAWSNETLCAPKMAAFRFRVGTVRSRAYDIRDMTNEFRAIALRYGDLNVTSYQIHRNVADQMNTVLPNTVQNLGIAVACMLIVSTLFIPSAVCTLWVALAIVSIDLGVVGTLSLWSVNIDPISMITLMMSIGFAVDFSAHIVYGFVSAPAHWAPRRRAVDAMHRLALPVAQGAVSTVLGMLVLATNHSYMVHVFFRTAVLVIAYGAVHALVFLPTLLCCVTSEPKPHRGTGPQ